MKRIKGKLQLSKGISEEKEAIVGASQNHSLPTITDPDLPAFSISAEKTETNLDFCAGETQGTVFVSQCFLDDDVQNLTKMTRWI